MTLIGRSRLNPNYNRRYAHQPQTNRNKLSTDGFNYQVQNNNTQVDPRFKNKVIQALKKIRRTPIGKKLFAYFKHNKIEVSFIPSNSNNATAKVNSSHKRDRNGVLHAEVHWGDTSQRKYHTQNGQIPFKDDQIIFHELVHILHSTAGNYSHNRNIEEWRTTGIAFDQNRDGWIGEGEGLDYFNENQYLWESNYPTRTQY